MSERKTPPFNRSEADEPSADPAAAENRTGQKVAPERSAYAEDPLVELARIVSESSHFPQGGPGSETSSSAPQAAPRQPAAPQQPAQQPVQQQPVQPQPAPPAQPGHPPLDLQQYELPDTFSSDLEAELIAELAPVYSPEPSKQAAPQPKAEPVQQPQPQRPVARQPEAPHVEKPMPRATPYVPGFQPPASHQSASRQPVVPEPVARAGDVPHEPVVPTPAPEPVQAQPVVTRAPAVEAPAVTPSVRAVRDDDFYFGDPLAYDPAAELPDDPSSNYADAAAQALEAAVQEELRLATLGLQDIGADTTGTEPDFGDYAEFREPGFDDVTPELEQDAPDYASSLEAGVGSSRISLSDSDLRSGFDTGYATSYTQQSYRVEPSVEDARAPVAPEPVAPELGQPEPVRREPEPVAAAQPSHGEQGYIEPSFGAGEMQWSETEDFYTDEPDFEQQSPAQPYAQPYAQPQGLTPTVDDFDLEDIFEAERDAAPARVQHGALPEHSGAEKRAAPHVEPRRKGLIAAAAIAAIVVVGGGIFAISGLFGDSGASGPPVRISAEPGPMKVFPEAREASSEPSPSKAIYDRVAGVQPRDEQLVSREEQPIANVPTTDGGGARTVGGADAVSPTTPKRVRTVVVRPDGTIIAAPDLPETAGSSTATPAATLDPNASAAAGANIRTVTTTPADNVPTVGGATGTDAGEIRVAATPEDASTGGSAQPSLSIADAGPLGTTLTPRAKPADAAALASAAAPAVNAPIQRSGPLDLTGGRTAAAPANPAPTPATTSAASVPSGTYVVQVSSQRTREQAEAAYASMQRRFPSILGNVNAIYPSADLGERGTFYRVRIPASSQAAAVDLCTQLKNAGGDCFIRRTE